MSVASLARDREALRAAARRFSLVVRAQSEDAQAWHALGMTLLTLGERAGACSAFRHALRLDGSRIHSQRALGNLLFDCGKFDEALHCFDSMRSAG